MKNSNYLLSVIRNPLHIRWWVIANYSSFTSVECYVSNKVKYAIEDPNWHHNFVFRSLSMMHREMVQKFNAEI